MKFIPNWPQYLAKIWASALRNSHLQNGQTLIEIAPGGTDKIASALNLMSFTGKIILIEPEIKALHDSATAYRKLLPNCNIMELQATAGQAVRLGVTSTDFVVANHPLDDMILGNALSQQDAAILFNDHYNKSVEATKCQWLSLTPQKLHLAQAAVVSEWQSLRSIAKQVVMSQYESFFFSQNNFSLPNRFAFGLMKYMRNSFLRNEKPLQIDVENPAMWLAA